MKHQQPVEEIIQKLPPKQQTLDFGSIRPWMQLPTADQQTCRDAITALLFQVAKAMRLENDHYFKENDEYDG